MCGRFDLTANAQTIVEHFLLQRTPKYQPSYNITPGRKILNIVQLEDGSRKSVNLFWGLVPSWAKDKKNSGHLINARMESVREKPSFRAAFRHRRCLIPATGFYEWHQQDAAKQAYHIHKADHGVLAFAGLWEQWQQQTETLYSCTIITMAATGCMTEIHQRMPAILNPADYGIWLDKATPPDTAFALLNAGIYPDLQATAVSNWVNNPQHDDPRCLQTQSAT
ncbi:MULTISPECIES: SOS response-associated peptidase [Methylomonas]|uniref:SOS response-associated peptidase n=1 Tax=Methylomonas TaxID=416 RepID=UPI001232F0BE|nr:SOS response-associated peptidase [Methylomonas rhizoryzae]